MGADFQMLQHKDTLLSEQLPDSAHLSGLSVDCGQDVFIGQMINATGNTGSSSGSHLHFEVCYNDMPQDSSYTVEL